MLYTPTRTPSTHIHRLPARSEGALWIRHVATHEEIAQLAYFYWEAGGRHSGTELVDWLRAERELNCRR